ncbi:MAG: MmgE/PrpD family protein [Ignisphaera sp.]
MTRPIAEVLSEFIRSTSYNNIPSRTIEKGKLCLLDYIGCAIGGSKEQEIKTLYSIIREFKGPSESTIIGYPDRVPAYLAAFINGGMGHVLQLDDGDRWTYSHVGTVIIPAALASCEITECSGKEFLTAIVLGYDIAMRIGYAINPSHFNRGFCPNSTLGVFGAAVAAGKIFELNEEALANALGSAGTMASGVEEFVIDGSASQVLNPAHASMDGVLAALLAKKGFTGSHTIIEGKRGFIRAFSDQYEPSKITHILGKFYQIEKVYHKPYPTCRGFHSAIDVILTIMEKENISHNDVTEIVVETYKYFVDNMCAEKPPLTPAHARLHMPYSLACAVVRKRVFIEEFTNESLKDKAILETIKKIRFISADDELNKFAPYPWGARVTIITKEGKKVFGEEALPKGEPENPLSYEELKSKFKALSLRIIKDENIVAEIIRCVTNIERISNIRELTSLLSLIP